MAFLTLDTNNTENSGTLLTNNGRQIGLEVDNPNGEAIRGLSHTFPSWGSPGPGVTGFADTGPGVAAGSDSGNAVNAVATKSGTGVQALAANGFGVEAYSTGFIGVYASAAAEGVWGKGGKVGVRGDSETGPGVFGASGAIGVSGDGREVGTGVVGTSDSGVGVIGDGGRSGIGMIAVGNDRGWALVTQTGHATSQGNYGDVLIQGALIVTGAPKSAAIKLRDGSHRSLYCVESPECWFEDFGRARLVRGTARVRLDRIFAAVVRTGDYHVFLSPEGLSHGLYVSRRTRDGFEVREQHRGKSTVRFSYRIVARRKDVDAPRFKRVKLPVLAKPPRLPKPSQLPRTVPSPELELKKLLGLAGSKKLSGGGLRRSRSRSR